MTVTVGKLSGADLAAYCVMLINKSMIESIQDEFEMSVKDVREQSEAVRDAARDYGSLENFLKYVEKETGSPIVEKSPQPQSLSKTPSISGKNGVKTRKRTSEGLRDALFDTINRLTVGEIGHKDALAICAVSMAICRTVQLEMDYAKISGANGGKDPMKPLQLGATDE
jgi:hypothetical protein